MMMRLTASGMTRIQNMQAGQKVEKRIVKTAVESKRETLLHCMREDQELLGIKKSNGLRDAMRFGCAAK